MMRFMTGVNSNVEIHSYINRDGESKADLDVVVGIDDAIYVFKRLLDSVKYMDEKQRIAIYGIARKIDNTMSFPVLEEKISCDECLNKYDCCRCENFGYMK